jgi:hypothetical protein
MRQASYRLKPTLTSTSAVPLGVMAPVLVNLPGPALSST